MSALSDLRDAIDHITARTGDGEAWKRGLTPADISTVGATVVDPDAAGGLLAKVRANHPDLFDARTGAPISPPVPSPGQRGEAVAAIQKAEDDLAQQNSASAQLDLHVVAAVLNAHATAGEGGARLRALQDEIEAAVRMRTDLDTAAGAREFQRFLIGKARQIAAVVESADLDAGSKAALATAWTALYRSGSDDTAPTESPTDGAAPVTRAAASPPPAPAPEALPPYGSDLGDDALANALLASAGPPPDIAPAAAAAPVQPASAAPPPSATPFTAPPMMSGLPSMPGVPALSGLLPDMARSDAASLRSARELDEPLDLPTIEDDPIGADLPDPDDPQAGDADAPEPSPPAGDCTTVRLPDGGEMHAPTAALAEVFRSALNGIPVVDAYRGAGITVPPPGTAVPHPVEPFRVVGGDIGMFSDRQALALDRDRAVLDGRIQPVATVGGPSFLGWLHPPSQGATTAASAPDPAAPTAPTQTRPAAADAR